MKIINYKCDMCLKAVEDPRDVLGFKRANDLVESQIVATIQAHNIEFATHHFCVACVGLMSDHLATIRAKKENHGEAQVGRVEG